MIAGREMKSICSESAIVTLGSTTSPKNYTHLMRNFGNRTPDMIVYFLWRNASRSDILKHSGLMHMEYSYFLFEEDDYVKLLTARRFPSPNCIRDGLIEINRFSKRSLRWESDKFKMQMFSSFHGCNLTNQVNPDLRGQTAINRLNVSGKILGKTYSRLFSLNQKIYEELAVNLNYKLVMTEKKGELRYFTFNPNMKIFIGSQAMRPYIFETLELAVPLGEEYNGFEKLILPFDDSVWTWILITFVSAFTTIFILKFTSQSVRNFIIGRNVTAPSLNVLKAVFGISQRSPGRNFARFLLMSFILYCLVMRTAWQGKMFEFLQKDMRKPEIRSIEEMNEKNYKLYVEHRLYLLPGTYNITKNSKSTRYVSLREIFERSTQLNDPGFKGIVEVPTDTLNFHAIATNGLCLMRTRLSQKLMSKFLSQAGVSLFLFKTLDEKIQQLVVGGVIDFYDRDYQESINPKRYAHLHPKGPKVLTLKHLKAGFVVCCVSMTFAIIVFIFECLQICFANIIVRRIIVAFYDLKTLVMTLVMTFNELV